MESLVHIYLKPDNELLKQKLSAIYKEEMALKKQKKIKLLEESITSSRYMTSRKPGLGVEKKGRRDLRQQCSKVSK
jgi:hypothetical protein